MARKAEALDWKAFMGGEVKPKVEKDTGAKRIEMIGMVVIAGTAYAFLPQVSHALPAWTAQPDAVSIPVMASGDFASSLSTATKPIHDLIKGFAHEIYAIFMAWGAIEAMIGKPQQGFTRMKTATLGYVLLYWVPTIIDLVNKSRPGV